LVGKPEGKGPHVCVDNIKMDRDGMDLIDLAHDRDQWRTLVHTVMNLQAP
jgi:hypothetical protein